MSKLDILLANEPDYYPSFSVAEDLNEVTLVPLTGPTAIGKSACMHYLVEADPDFGRVQSFTTRPMRPGESTEDYRFLPHDEATISSIVSEVLAGELVQYAVHPTTGCIYGSDRRDYSRPYMMLDILASSVPTIRKLPFGNIVEMAVVAEPEEWQQRFNSRSADPAEARKRLVEGRNSLEISLDQGEAMIWICNTEGALAGAGNEIHDIALGRREPDPLNRKVGERLFRVLDDLVLAA